MTDQYVPPTVWTYDTENGGKWAKTNRPESGATHERALPCGSHPLQLYSLATPNGQKITIMLEELLALGKTEVEYDAWLIDISEADQFSTGFVQVNPNSKIPALIDRSYDKPISVFESGSILVYLAEKCGCFLPTEPHARTHVMNWLFWLHGSAPYLGGGFGHFYAYAPEKFEYPINRFAMEVKRQLDLLNKQLADKPFIAGDSFSIADIAIWPWYGNLVLGKLYDAATFLSVDEYPHLIRWANQIAARPAVKRGGVVNKIWGDDPMLRERHAASDIDHILNHTD